MILISKGRFWKIFTPKWWTHCWYSQICKWQCFWVLNSVVNVLAPWSASVPFPSLFFFWTIILLCVLMPIRIFYIHWLFFTCTGSPSINKMNYVTRSHNCCSLVCCWCYIWCSMDIHECWLLIIQHSMDGLRLNTNWLSCQLTCRRINLGTLVTILLIPNYRCCISTVSQWVVVIHLRTKYRMTHQ